MINEQFSSNFFSSSNKDKTSNANFETNGWIQTSGGWSVGDWGTRTYKNGWNANTKEVYWGDEATGVGISDGKLNLVAITLGGQNGINASPAWQALNDTSYSNPYGYTYAYAQLPEISADTLTFEYSLGTADSYLPGGDPAPKAYAYFENKNGRQKVELVGSGKATLDLDPEVKTRVFLELVAQLGRYSYSLSKGTLVIDNVVSIDAPPAYSLTPSSTSINEGSALTTSVITTNVASGTTLYWSAGGTGVTAADFSSGALTGSGVIGTDGKFSFVHTASNDLTTEGDETLQIKLFTDSARTAQVGSTASVTLKDTSFVSATPVVRGNSLYTIVDGPSWTQAEAQSVSLSGHLTSISSEDENVFLVESFRDYNKEYTPGNRDVFWIGAKTDARGGINISPWKWTTGEEFIYQNFNSNSAYGASRAIMNTYYSGEYGGDWWRSDAGSWIDTDEGSGQAFYGIAEIPLISSISFSSAPKEGAGLFTTSINLSAGTQTTGNLAEGAPVWWKVTGITADDLVSGALTGTGNITNGKIDILHSLKADADTGEKFEVSVYSDADRTQQIGATTSAATLEATGIRGSFGSDTDMPSGDDTSIQLLDGTLVLIANKSLRLVPAPYGGGDHLGTGLIRFIDPNSGATNKADIQIGNGKTIINGIEKTPDGGFIIYGQAKESLYGKSFGGATDAFVIKYNASGIQQWIQAFNTQLHESISGASVDASGNILLSGRASYDLSEPRVFGSQSWYGQALGGRYYAAFSGQLSSSGDLNWVNVYGGLSGGLGIAADSNGYLAAIYTGVNSSPTNYTYFDKTNKVIWSRDLQVNDYSAAVEVFYGQGISAIVSGLSQASLVNSAGTTIATIPEPLGRVIHDIEVKDDTIYLLARASGGGSIYVSSYKKDGTALGTPQEVAGTSTYSNEYFYEFDLKVLDDGSFVIGGNRGSSSTLGAGVGEYREYLIANAPSPTFLLATSSTSINEGTPLTTTVATTNVSSGTTLYWSIAGTGVTAADFSSGGLTGSGAVGTDGKFSFVHTAANDLTTEGVETLQIKLFTDTARTVQVGSTASVTLKDTSNPLVRGNSLYTIVDGPSWTQAEANAVKLGGHLVSIGSDQENKFIYKEFSITGNWSDPNSPCYLIGLTDRELEGVWKWSNGEEASYINWIPDGITPNGGRNENYVHLGRVPGGYWNDDEDIDPRNLGGIAETTFIRRGDSAYVIVSGPTWEEAEANAVKLGGHLVTINDAAENEWIQSSFFNLTGGLESSKWIGAADTTQEGKWKWSSSDNFSYANWALGEPTNTQHTVIGEDYAAFAPNGLWFDIPNGPIEAPSIPWLANGLIGIAEITLAPNNTPTGTPALSGTLKAGQVITIDKTPIQDADNFTGYTPDFKYSWEVANDPGMTMMIPVWESLNTADATDGDETFTITADLTGKLIRGVVSYLDGYGTQESVASIASAPITSSAPPVQSLTLSAPSKSTIRSGVNTTSAIAYTVSTGEKNLTGVGASLYFDSTQLTVTTAGEPFKTGLLGSTITADTTNADDDPKTDKVLSLTYADFGGNFPGGGTTLPLTLANLNLVPTATYTGTTLHLKSSPASGYTATGADLTLGYNASPIVNSTLPALTTNRGSAFSYTVPSTLFSDPDSTLTFSATTATGTALPSWLSFNPATRTLSGTPTTGGTLNLNLSASDELGSVSTPLSIKVREVQQLSSSTSTIRYQRNKDFTLPINYSTTDGSSSTGLAFKVHFNSNLFSFDPTTGVTNKAQADLFQIGSVQQDTADTDNDPTTDRFIPISIASFSGQFPSGSAPSKLADLTFRSADKAIDPITGLRDTSINFTESSVASGYGFSGSSASLKPLSFSLDVDGDGLVTPLGDGLMVIRYLFGSAFAGDALINKAISPDSPLLGGKSYTSMSPTEKAGVASLVATNIQQGIDSKLLDVDKDGMTTPLGDGLMVIRRLFGSAFEGAALTSKAISPESPYFGPPADFAAVAANIDALKPTMAVM